MDSKYFSLDDILSDSEFGDTFKVKPTNTAVTTDQRLIESFEEINEFIDHNRHEPQSTTDIHERKLYKRLAGIRSDKTKQEILVQFDRHNILHNLESPIKSIDNILKNDFLADILGLDDTATDIFNLKHVKHISEREDADFIARRKVCKSFDNYEPLFKKCHAEIQSGARQFIRFSEANLRPHTYFIVNGILGYLEIMDNLEKDKSSKLDGRVHCIFENGTESNMLFRSLGKALYENGCIVSSTNEESNNDFNHGLGLIDDNDESTGHIYILKSKSTDEKISSIDNLYKIGYSTIPVEERIRDAINEPTYLMADVEVISIYECYNLNAQKFEHILHTFFAQSCLNIDVFGENNKRVTPREWFIVPLGVIQHCIDLILSGEIMNHVYDAVDKKIRRIAK